MPMFSKGIVLAQHKEPAFSKPLLRFVNPQTDSLRLSVRGIAVPTKEEAIIEIARLAQIVDERDGKLLYRKLQKSRGRAKIVIADALDDEPYVSSKVAPLLQLREDVADGLDLCCEVAGCDKKLIMVYKMVTDLETRIPRSLNKVKIVRVRGGYPADQKRRLRRFGEGPRLIVGAGALIHLARAVYEHKKQSTVFVTVAGSCVANPMNLEVSIGMTVMQVLERCGLAREPSRIVCGGSMTGISIIDGDKTLVTYTTKAILAYRENYKNARYTCIGCGRCEQVCPAGLNPMYIYRFVQNSYYANLAPFDAHLCIGCGTCSYICPSKLEVAPAVGRAREYALRHFVAPQDPDADELSEGAAAERPPQKPEAAASVVEKLLAMVRKPLSATPEEAAPAAAPTQAPEPREESPPPGAEEPVPPHTEEETSPPREWAAAQPAAQKGEPDPGEGNPNPSHREEA